MATILELEREELIRVFRENYPEKTLEEIAQDLGIKRSTLYWRMRKAGIRLGRAVVAYGERIEVGKN